MKVVIFFISMFMVSYANYIVVINDDINLTIDGKEQKYQTGKYQLPRDSIQLCYISGDGKALVNGNYNRSLYSNSSFSCYQLPQEKGANLEKIIDKFYTVYRSKVIDIRPSVKSAVGKRNIQLLEQLVGDMEIDKNTSYLVIKSEDFGLPPVRLNVKDRIGNIKFSYENTDSNISVFVIDMKKINNGDMVEVLNVTGDVILKRKIILTI